MKNKTIEAILTWLEIAEANGRCVPCSADSLRCAIDHSSLLNRLLEGKEPLPDPPPRAMSYPWYSLIENGKDYPYEVFFVEQEVVIEQMSWQILEKINDNQYIVSYDKNKSSWRLSKTNEKWGDGSDKWELTKND